MQASLPMYDWPELREATDAWWTALAAAFRAEGIENVPDRLTRDAGLEALWGAPDLLFSQTCGYPLTHEWAGRLQPVATPHYTAEGCSGADYCSFLLVRTVSGITELKQLEGLCAAYNGPDSQSGYSALRAVAAPLASDGRFFGRTVLSGSHLASMEMVTRGEADVCAVDAVVWGIVCRHRAEFAEALAVIARSPSAPALPYVTSPGTLREDVRRMTAAFEKVFDDQALSDIRDQLMLSGFSVLDEAEYGRILDIELDSVERGYPGLT